MGGARDRDLLAKKPAINIIAGIRAGSSVFMEIRRISDASFIRSAELFGLVTIKNE
jgi:hypothetical protein